MGGQPMKCKVFGALWEVQWLPDCNACGSMNGFFCDGTVSSDCNTPVANFNNMIFVPPTPHRYKDDTAALIGCCMLESQRCDFPVCDCATVAAAVTTGQAQKQTINGGSALFIDNPIWWGACPLRTYGSSSFETTISNNGDAHGYVMTSLGMTWSEVYRSYWVLKNLSNNLVGLSWKSVARHHPLQVAHVTKLIKATPAFAKISAAKQTVDAGPQATSCHSRRRSSCTWCQYGAGEAGGNGECTGTYSPDLTQCNVNNCQSTCHKGLCTCKSCY